jgi:Polyketide cyclase / dehydrase and lipid transport
MISAAGASSTDNPTRSEAMRGSVTLDVDAPAERVYAMVSDVTRYGEWSPENLGGVWLDGATGPIVGARFKAKNKRKLSWSTTSTVVVADEPSEFTFAVGKNGHTRWSYRMESRSGGCKVTESFETPDDVSRIERFLTRIATGLRWDERRADLESNMRATLERLKAAAEQL